MEKRSTTIYITEIKKEKKIIMEQCEQLHDKKLDNRWNRQIPLKPKTTKTDSRRNGKSDGTIYINRDIQLVI